MSLFQRVKKISSPVNFFSLRVKYDHIFEKSLIPEIKGFLKKILKHVKCKCPITMKFKILDNIFLS